MSLMLSYPDLGEEWGYRFGPLAFSHGRRCVCQLTAIDENVYHDPAACATQFEILSVKDLRSLRSCLRDWSSVSWKT